MNWENILYTVLHVSGILISLGVARYAWLRRSIPGARYFALFNLCAVQWALSSILVLVTTNPELRDFWNVFGMIGVLLNPVMWLAFTLEYTGRGRWLTPRSWILIAGVPVGALLLLVGVTTFYLVRGLPLTGALSWAGVVVLAAGVAVILLLLTATFVILQELILAPRMYRGRYLTLLLGIWGPWVFGALSLFGDQPLAVALLPVGYAAGGLIATWGIFRYKVFDIIPVALDTVIKSIGDGVIVLDIRDRIIDLNPAAERIVNLPAQQAIGRPINRALVDWKEFLQRLEQERVATVTGRKEPIHAHSDAAQGQALCSRDGGYYELRTSPLRDRREELSGRLILLHDVTARVQVEQELRRISDERARRNRELTLLNRVIATTTSRLEPTAVLEAVCRELTQAFDLPLAAVAMLNDTRTSLTVVAESGVGERPSGVGDVIPVTDNPATQYVLEHKAPLAVTDAQHDPRMAPVHGLMRQHGIASLLILPLIVRDEVVGTLGLDAFERREFSDEEITLAANATAAAAQALEKARAEEVLRQARAAAEKARRAAERSAQAAESANRAKSVFLANMSHELRTPLNAILGFAQLMTRDPALTADQKENLETIGRSGEHLLALINDVLELSKIEAGRVALHEESFDLHRLLDGLEEMFELRVSEKGLVLIFDRAPDVPQYVRADEGKLRQVLLNLLGNAVKFTQEGGVTLRIACAPSGSPGSFRHAASASGPPKGAEAGGRRLRFEVEDTGPGIAPEELDAVFDPFRQTKSGQASQEGTGLGMPISRQFVRLMGGDLTVRSELGSGTLFEFDVQIALADAADIPAAQVKRRVIGLQPDQPVFRLLVVEDREPNRRLLVKMLAPLGFEMYEAVNGQQGIEMWERYQPHLVWMDMRMPVMDGNEATQRIKATTMGQATVVVALTASAFERDRAMILSGGCDDFVRKPFREEEILDVLAKHLGVRFVYEEDAQPGGVPAEPEGGALSAADLTGLPPEWVASLYEAAAQLDADLVLDRIEQVRASNAALADGLARLVRDFRFDVIMAVSAGAEGDDA